MHKRVPPIVKTILVILVILITVVFLTKTLLEYYEQAKHAISSISPIKIIAAFLLFLGHFYMRVFSWRSIVSFLGANISKQDSLLVWFFSEATRYIPGNIWSFASRAYLAQQKGVLTTISILILPIEIIVVVITTSVLSSYAIIKTIEKLPVDLTFYIGILISLITLIVVFLLYKRIKKILRKLFNLTLNPEKFLTILLFQILSWSFYGIGVVVLVNDLPNLNLFLLLSSALLAWLIGYLSIITPMGLGVREGAFVLLTGQQIGIGQAVVVAVLSRTILIIAELTNLAFWAYFSRRKSY